jgi:hypothetical protein
LLLALALLAAPLLLSACGGGGDDDGEATSTTAAAAPQAQATSVAEETSTSAESGEDSGTAGPPTTETIDTTESGAAAPDQATAGTASPADDAAIRAAIQAYIDAFVAKDGEKACALMKPEVAEAFLEGLRDQVSAEDCADAFEQAAASGGEDLANLFKQATVDSVAVEGDKATAQMTVLGTSVPIIHMERIDGEWKVANLPGQ